MISKPIPTAENWIKEEMNNIVSVQEAAEKLKAFTKLHVESALIQASEKASTQQVNNHLSIVYKPSILNSYPLDLIK